MRKPFANPNRLTAAALALAGVAGLAAAQPVDDPFLWLEEVQGEKALAWAREQNAKTLAVLEARPQYKPVYARTLEILDSKEKIPTPQLLGETVYNFWKDDTHERGIWRRTRTTSKSSRPATMTTPNEKSRIDSSRSQSWWLAGGTGGWKSPSASTDTR